MKKLILGFFLCSIGLLYAQHPSEVKGRIQQESLTLNIDSLALSALHIPDTLHTDTNMVEPPIMFHLLPDMSYFQSNPLFTDLIYSGLKIGFSSETAWDGTQLYDRSLKYGKPVSAYFSNDFRVMNFVDSLRDYQREKIIAFNTMWVKNHIWNLPDPNEFFVRHIASPGSKDMYLHQKLERVKFQKMKVLGVEKDPWSTKGNVAMQLSQNYTSSNWYQGGKSNLATLFVFEASANYDDQKKIQWDNSISMKMGLQSESADTVRHYSVTENQIRLSSKLGLKAFENWYYSLSGELTTYSLTAYSALNSETKVNGFLSPFRLDIGLGMDYKYKQQLSVLVTPLSFKYIYFADTLDYNKKNFGVLEGKRTLHEFGSLIKVEGKKKLSAAVDLSTRFSFYTNYKKVEVDWEVTTTFVLTRYLSFMTTLHPRYDTAVIAAGDKNAKIQMKELMSFGFAYKFNNIKARNKRFH